MAHENKKANDLDQTCLTTTDWIDFGLLLDAVTDKHRMSLTELHGFITAILTFSSESYGYNRVIQHYQFDKGSQFSAQFEKSLLHLFECTKESLSRLNVDLILFDDHQQLVPFDTGEPPLIRDWCRGYLMAISDESIWQYDQAVLGMLESIVAWADIDGSEQSIIWAKRGMSLSKLTWLPHRSFLKIVLHLLYVYWRPIHIQFQQQYFFCSCGSSIDFRLCCYQDNSDFN
jgi:hypothetical protein